MNVSIAQIIAKDENHVWLPEHRKVKKKEYKKAGNGSLHEYALSLAVNAKKKNASKSR